MNEDLSFPIGKFNSEYNPTPESRLEFIKTISDLPSNLTAAVSGLNEGQIDTPYRPGGWTVRQTVHHVADSHFNSFCRFKLALTEDLPTIRPYYEDRWAELGDNNVSAELSLKIIEGLHSRWASLLESMSDLDFQKRFNHPETGAWTLEKALAMYAWHSRHHTAHITRLREKNGW
ncbi:MAG: putative metal-dependent hydrolase [Acidobacteriota bacterium]|nr:putative metal-dependent hydrolase [Acidobacteriota bacterium]